MKKICITLLLLSLILGTLPFSSLAADDGLTVSVTISDDKGALALAGQNVTVTDTDSDGKLTICDALFAAHQAHFEGGAEAGFACSNTAYGLSLDKLWGVSNGGSYGYYLNDASAMSLLDEIKDGDCINAFVYTDLTAWSDTYCYFDQRELSAAPGRELTLTLLGAGYDENFAPISFPVEGATITINGNETAFTTDKDGKVTLTYDAEGTVILSAKSATMTLVPPVCTLTSVGDLPDAGEQTVPYILVSLFCLTALCGVAAGLKNRRNEES